MPFIALVLIIIAAFLHASWNFVAKKSGGTTIFAFLTALVTSILWLPVVGVIHLTTPEVGISTWSTEAWLIVTCSALIHSIYYLVLLHGYKVAPLSVVYPIARGTGPLLSFFAAIIIFDENLTIYSAFGVFGIACGIILLTWSKDISFLERSSLRGLGWGVLTGIAISIYTITDAYAVKTLNMNPILFDYFGGLIRTFMLLPLVIGKGKELRENFVVHRKSVLIISIISPLAYILVLSAILIAPVSHVAPARELSMLVGAFLGGKLLDEGHLQRRMCGAALIAIGVICLVI
jgi:drug/metabolite transporter (DMT)-like permease